MTRRQLHRRFGILSLCLCAASGVALQGGYLATGQAASRSGSEAGPSAPRQAPKNTAPVTQTATMAIVPVAGTFDVGATFSVSLTINGGGQNFDTADAVVTLTGPVTVTSFTLTPPASGGCGFTTFFPWPSRTSPSPPSANYLSFTGSVLGGSTSRCTLYTLQVQVTGPGAFGIALSDAGVYSGGAELLSSSGLTSGVYAAATAQADTPAPPASPTPTNTATATPTHTPTGTPTQTATSPPAATPSVLMPGQLNTATATVSATATPTVSMTPTVMPVVTTTPVESSLPANTASPTATGGASSPTVTAVGTVATVPSLVIHNTPRTVVGGRVVVCNPRVNLKRLAAGCEILSSVSAPGVKVVYTIVYPGKQGPRQTFTDTADYRGHSLHFFNVAYMPPTHAVHGSAATVATISVSVQLSDGKVLAKHTRFTVVR